MRELTREEIRMLRETDGPDAILVSGVRRTVAEKLMAIGLVHYSPRMPISAHLPWRKGGHEFRVSITLEGRRELSQLAKLEKEILRR
jgi:hypothetical protein